MSFTPFLDWNLLFLNFHEVLSSFVLKLLLENRLTQFQSLLGKKMRCVKVLSIGKAVKAKQYIPKISKIWLIRCDQARSQKFAMGEAVLGVCALNVFAAGGKGVWGRNLSAWKFCIFLQKYLSCWAILTNINAFRRWRRNWECKHDYTGGINGLWGKWLMVKF